MRELGTLFLAFAATLLAATVVVAWFWVIAFVFSRVPSPFP